MKKEILKLSDYHSVSIDFEIHNIFVKHTIIQSIADAFNIDYNTIILTRPMNVFFKIDKSKKPQRKSIYKTLDKVMKEVGLKRERLGKKLIN